jgi:hypothetical protein
MGVLESPVRPRTSALAGAVLVAFVLLLGGVGAQSVTAAELKAAYLFNFAQFVEWPALAAPAGTPLALCVVQDNGERTVKGRTASGRGLTVKLLNPGATFPTCHVLYLTGANLQRSLDGIETAKSLFVLTVSDTARFAQTGGIVELFTEDSRMRFAVNVDALQRAQIRLSSRLLTLAKIVHDAKERPRVFLPADGPPTESLLSLSPPSKAAHSEGAAHGTLRAFARGWPTVPRVSVGADRARAVQDADAVRRVRVHQLRPYLAQTVAVVG